MPVALKGGIQVEMREIGERARDGKKAPAFVLAAATFHRVFTSIVVRASKGVFASVITIIAIGELFSQPRH